MKLNKSQLKALIKECLVEVLAEGIGGSIATLNEHVQPSTRKPRRRTRNPVAAIMNSSLDEQATHYTQRQRQAPAQPSGVKMPPNINPEFASIFADTAKTTFQKQPKDLVYDSEGNIKATSNMMIDEGMLNEVAVGAPKEAIAAAMLDPTELESSDRWAHLAFNTMK